MEFDVAVLNGRMRPPTLAHIEGIIRPALKRADQLVVNLGSCFAPPSLRNPLTGNEVAALIRACLTAEENDRVTINRIPDFLYNDPAWVETVQAAVKVNVKPNAKIALAGHSKDNTSYYLKMFPQWGSINLPNYKGIDATKIRNIMFADGLSTDKMYQMMSEYTYPQVVDFILSWMKDEKINPYTDMNTYNTLLAEQRFVEKYREEWGEGPFNTGDGVVFQAGSVLMIRRGGLPGKGLLALPGGFLDLRKNETLLECSIRETYEETKLDMPRGVFAASVGPQRIFDIPHRDPRGRIITFAAAFDLDHEMDRKVRNRKDMSSPLYNTKVKGSDDAAEAMWIPLNELNSEEVFADHYHIIQKMKALLDKDKVSN